MCDHHPLRVIAAPLIAIPISRAPRSVPLNGRAVERRLARLGASCRVVCRRCGVLGCGLIALALSLAHSRRRNCQRTAMPTAVQTWTRMNVETLPGASASSGFVEWPCSCDRAWP